MSVENTDRVVIPPNSTFDPLDSVRLWKSITTQLDLAQERPEDHMHEFMRTLQQSRVMGFKSGISVSSLMIAKGHLYHGDYQKSIEMNLLAVRFAPNNLYGYRIITTAYVNIANAFNSLGRNDYAMYYYSRAAHLINTHLNNERIEYIYTNLSGVLPSNFALYYLHKAKTIAHRKGNDSVLCMVLVNMAYHLQNLDAKSEEARHKLEQALALSRKINYVLFEYRALVRLGAYFLELDSTEKAIDVLRQAERLMPKGDEVLSFRNRDLLVFGCAWMQLKNYQKAENYFHQSLSTAQHLKLYGQMALAYQNLASIAESRGSLREALDYHKKYVLLKDSALNATTLTNIQDLEVRFRTAEKDKEIAQKEKAIEKRNFLVAGATLGCGILLSGLFLFYRHTQQKQKLLQQQQELLRLQALMEGEEIERSRIARELHDGIMVNFSSVKMNLGAVMKRYPDTEETKALEVIIRQLDDATRELRKSAHNLMPDMLLREGLIAAVRYFCHSLSQSGKMEIEFQNFGSSPEIAAEKALLLYRTVQELLQNVIKYADANHVIVQIDNTGDLLTITVEDNGVGFELSVLQENRGMGLRNIRSRIETLGGIMNIETQPGKGTSIYIEIETVTLR